MNHISIDELSVGDKLPERNHTPTNVSLFMYNAAIWNAHRIHYDEPYSKNVEGHPGVVVDGPLQGDWLSQTVINWVADAGTMIELEYSNRKASHLGDTLHSGGTITGVDIENRTVELELFVKDKDGNVLTPGRAIVRLN